MEFADCYALLSRALYFFGLMPFKFSEDKSHLVSKFADNFAVFVSIFLTIMASTFAVVLKTVVETFMDAKSPDSMQGIMKTAQQGQVYVSTVIYLALMITAIIKKHHHMKLIETIVSVDKDLVKFFSCDLYYSKLRKFINIILPSLIMCNSIFSLCIICYMTIMKNNFLSPSNVVVYVASQTYPQYLTMHYCILCWLITNRFKVIENLSKSYLTNQQFKNLLNTNRNLRQAVFSLNDALGCSQFLIIFNNNIMITGQIFLTLYTIFSINGNIYLHWNIGALWFVFIFFVQVVYTAKIGNDLKVQVMKTNKALEDNTNLAYESKQIELISGCPFDRLYGFKLECSAGGYFVIDNSLITLMVSSITSYLVILLTFEQQRYE